MKNHEEWVDILSVNIGLPDEVEMRAGGAEPFENALKEEGEEDLAESVPQHAACTTAAEIIVLEH